MAKRIRIIPWLDESQLNKQLNDIGNRKEKIKVDIDSTNINNANKQIQQLNKAVSNSNSLFGNLKNGMKLFSHLASPVLITMKTINEVKQAISFTKELNSALTNINYTMDVTASQLEQIGQKSISMAKDLNTSAENVLGAVKLYANAKETADSILQKAQPAIMLSNVTGFSGEQSAKYLQTIMNQFDLAQDDLMNISDIVQGVSQSIAHDFADGIVQINEGIETSGEVARAAGMDLAEYASMIGLLVEKTGLQGSQLGNSIKTIITRTTRAGKILGIDEGEISDAEKSLKNVGIAVRETDGEFREFQDTMRDLSEVWDNLSEVEKSNIAFNLAGTRQINVIQTLLRNWSDYEELVVKANNSAGVTFENQEKYAESLEGKMEGLSATMTSVWENLINEDSVSPALNILLKLAEGFDKITGKLGLLGTVGAGAGLFAGFKNVGIFRTITDDVTKANKSVKLFGLSLKNAIDTQAVTLYNTEIAKGTNAQEALALASKGTNKATIALMQSANGAAVSTEQLTAAQKASTIAAKAQSAALKAVSIAGNMLIFTAISKAISFVTEKFDEWMHRVERAKEALDESNSTYETAVSDLENLQKELQETADRMADLETDGITLVEQEEYERLVETNKELERTIALKKIEQQADARQAASDAVDLYNKMFKGTTAPSQENAKSFADDEMFGAKLLEVNNKDINDLLSAYLSIQEQIKKTKAEMDTLVDNDDEESQNRLIELQEQLELGEAYLTDYSSLITEYSQNYQDILDGINAKKETGLELTASEIETYNNANTALDLISNTLLSVQERLEKLISKNGWEESLTDLFNSEKSLSEITEVLSAQYPELSAFIDAAGMSVEELAQKFTTLEEAKREVFNNEAPDLTASASQIINQLNTQLKPAFDSLKSAYKDIFSDDGFNLDAVDIPMLESIKSDIEELNNMEDVDISINMDDFDKFAKILTDVNTTEEQAHQAFDDLATSIFNATTATEGMTDETVKLVEQLLESLGVVNATKVAKQALMESKAQTVLATYDLINATENEYVAILAEGEAAGVTRQAIYSLMAAEIAFGQNDLSVEQKIAKLHDLATAYGDTASAALATAIANDLASGHTDVDTAINDLMAKINEGLSKVDIDIDFSGANSAAKSAGSKAGKEYKDAFKEEVDKLKSVLSGIISHIDKQIDAYGDEKDAAVSALETEKSARIEVIETQKKQLEEQIKLIDAQIKAKQKIIDGIQDEIDAMKDANDERKRQVTLQEKLYQLERMQHQRTILQYFEEKGIHYVQDLEGTRKAKDEVEDAKLEIEIANKEKQIKLIEKEINLLEERKDAINEQIDLLDAQIDQINDYYDKLIFETERYWDSLIKNMEDYKSRWQELNEVEDQAKLIARLKELGITTDDIINMSAEAFEKFKDRYLATLIKVNEGNAEVQNSIAELGGSAGSIQPISDALNDTADSIDNLSGSASTASQTVSDTATNLDTAATNAGTLRDNLTDINTAISDEQTAFDNLKQTIDEVIQAINDKIAAIQDEQNAVNIATSREISDFLLLRDKILEVKDSIDEVGTTVTDLDAKTFDNITNSFQLLYDKIILISGALGSGIEGSGEGVTNSIASAIQALNDISLEEGIIAQFNNLKTAIDEVTSAISGGGGESSGGEGQGSQSGSGSSGSNGGQGSESGNSLSSAITQMGETANEVIGEPEAEGDGTVIGEFGSMKTAVNEVSEAIGIGGEEGTDGGNGQGEDDDTLIGSITNLGVTTEETLGESGGDGVIGRFEEFKDVIGEANEHITGISEGLAAIDGQEVECTIKVNIETTGGLPAFAEGTLGNMNLESAEYNAKYGKAYATGYQGLPKDEKNALVSEYGQPEMTVFPNGETVITDSPTMMDLPKGTVIFNEDQTKKIMNGKPNVGTAHAQGTADDGVIITPDGRTLRPLQPGDNGWDLQQKFNAALEKFGHEQLAEMLTPVNAIQRDMEQMVKSISTINNISNDNSRMQNITNEFHITMPNVTDSTTATELMRDLQSLGTKKMQFFDSRF